MSYHFYPHSPDGACDHVGELANMLQRYAPHATLRQGETGVPSEIRRFMAMGAFARSERKQAAW